MTGKKGQIGLVLSMMLCLVTMMVGSCKDDEMPPHGQGDSQDGEAIVLNTFTCTKEAISSEGLGAVFDSTGLVWEKSDILVVFAKNDKGVDSAWYVPDFSKGKTTFVNKSGKDLKGKKFTIVYNKGNERGIIYKDFGKVDSIRLPQIQQAIKGSFDPTAAPMIGKMESAKDTSGWKATMYPICAYVEVNTTGDWPLVKLTSTNGLHLSTENMLIDFSGKEIKTTTHDTITSVILNNVKGYEKCYMTVLPAKVGKDITVELGVQPDYVITSCEQNNLANDDEFKRNKYFKKVSFTGEEWKDMDGTPLLLQNAWRIENGIATEFFTSADVHQYMEEHSEEYKMLRYSDFMDESWKFYYTKQLHWDEANAADYILWKNFRHYFPLKGYYDEDGKHRGDSIVARTWCLNFNNDTAYYEFDKMKNVDASKEPSKTVKYNLRLKKIIKK